MHIDKQLTATDTSMHTDKQLTQTDTAVHTDEQKRKRKAPGSRRASTPATLYKFTAWNITFGNLLIIRLASSICVELGTSKAPFRYRLQTI